MIWLPAFPRAWERTVPLMARTIRGFHAVVLLGIGWDRDHPIRPWPWITVRRTRSGGTGTCLSCCTLFLNFTFKKAR